MGLGVFFIASDFTALSVIVPRIEAQFHTSLDAAQWVINGYALVFGVLIVTGGRLADMFGRKRAFLAGATVFAVFSLASALMPDIYGLIACRALMGAGGAVTWPAVLGLTYAILPAGRKALAGGLILGVAGLGNAVGPLLGGWLADAADWRAVFLVNLPVTGLAMLATWWAVPESRAAQPAGQGMDYRGIVLLSGGTVAVLLALNLSAGRGFGSPAVLGPLAAGLVLLAAFAAVERRRGEQALIPAAVLRNRVFAAASGTVLLISATFFSALVFLPQFMERALGYTPLRSGAGLLPMLGAFALTSFAAAPLYNRFGPRLVVCAGAGLLAAGIFLLSGLSQARGYPGLVPGMVVLGVGVGLFYSAITTAAVTALDPSQSSLAGGIIYMCQVAGGAVGLGLNTAIVAGTATLAAGITVAFRVDAALGLAGLVTAACFVRGPRRSAAHAAAGVAHHRMHA
jgi:EmrB/QacA subfamily drug resistance transporter